MLIPSEEKCILLYLAKIRVLRESVKAVRLRSDIYCACSTAYCLSINESFTKEAVTEFSFLRYDNDSNKK